VTSGSVAVVLSYHCELDRLVAEIGREGEILPSAQPVTKQVSDLSGSTPLARTTPSTQVALAHASIAASEGVSGSSLAKRSVSRHIKKSVLERYPQLEPSEELSHLDNILGDKKQPLYVIKWYTRERALRMTLRGDMNGSWSHHTLTRLLLRRRVMV
jgi:hypothetical protein